MANNKWMTVLKEYNTKEIGMRWLGIYIYVRVGDDDWMMMKSYCIPVAAARYAPCYSICYYIILMRETRTLLARPPSCIVPTVQPFFFLKKTPTFLSFTKRLINNKMSWPPQLEENENGK